MNDNSIPILDVINKTHANKKRAGSIPSAFSGGTSSAAPDRSFISKKTESNVLPASPPPQFLTGASLGSPFAENKPQDIPITSTKPVPVLGKDAVDELFGSGVD